MRILTAALLLTTATATAAFAQTNGAGDAQYLKAARCAGLASSANLGGDAGGYNAWLKQHGGNRTSFIMEQADSRRAAARTQANRAKGYNKTQLEAELSGACAGIKG